MAARQPDPSVRPTSVPYAWLRSDGPARARASATSTFNYRYQAWIGDARRAPAFAPRISLILPTGSRNRGLGDGSVGRRDQVHRSARSSAIASRCTPTPACRICSTCTAISPTSYKVGGSGIYAVTRDFNLLLEGVVEWDESVNDALTVERETTFTLNPGFRKAINFP